MRALARARESMSTDLQSAAPSEGPQAALTVPLAASAMIPPINFPEDGHKFILWAHAL
jgi:hypothetical protein